MTKKLELVFALADGKSMTLSLADPRGDVTKAEAEAAMQEIIAKAAFVGKSDKLASVKAVKLYTSETAELA